MLKPVHNFKKPYKFYLSFKVIKLFKFYLAEFSTSKS
jgi:hypothetical protein